MRVPDRSSPFIDILFIPSFHKTIPREISILYHHLSRQNMCRPTALVVTGIAKQCIKDYLITSANLQQLRSYLGLPPSRLMLLPSTHKNVNYFRDLYETCKLTPYVHPQIMTMGNISLIGLDPEDDLDTAINQVRESGRSHILGIVRHKPLDTTQSEQHSKHVSFQLQGTRNARAERYGVLDLGAAKNRLLYLRFTPELLTCETGPFRDGRWRKGRPSDFSVRGLHAKSNRLGQ